MGKAGDTNPAINSLYCTLLHAFGAPRVGDRAFAATLGRSSAFTVVHGRDVVPELPPSSPLLGFAPAGAAVAVASVVERGGRGDPPPPFADHAPVVTTRRSASISPWSVVTAMPLSVDRHDSTGA